jgi:hypothetical protein
VKYKSGGDLLNIALYFTKSNLVPKIMLIMYFVLSQFVCLFFVVIIRLDGAFCKVG